MIEMQGPIEKQDADESVRLRRTTRLQNRQLCLMGSSVLRLDVQQPQRLVAATKVYGAVVSVAGHGVSPGFASFATESIVPAIVLPFDGAPAVYGAAQFKKQQRE